MTCSADKFRGRELATAWTDGLISDDEIWAVANEDFRSLFAESPDSALRIADALMDSRLSSAESNVEVAQLWETLQPEDAQVATELLQKNALDLAQLLALRRHLYRRRAIVALRAEGWTYGQLAHAFKIPRCQVVRVLKERSRRLSLRFRMRKIRGRSEAIDQSARA
ncbi:hypothetical protein [Marinobacter goseongensis]|uniref:hypothetical protein n=1 Tax=Marinobacter goseongensis TaxID=453838 RepID=UPI002004E0C3|nr:hypothetical protein [Marinobacter goseongensis]MCK7553018.1 hypothetical protein [Marinobacter goseongensis]